MSLYNLEFYSSCLTDKTRLTYFQYMANLMAPTLEPRLICEGLYPTPKIDVYLGCSEQLVKVCSRIADLRRVDDFAILSLKFSDMWVDYLLSHKGFRALTYHRNEYLTNWSYKDQSFIIPKGVTEAAIDRLEMVANCFRYAAFIFLHSSLERMAWPITSSTTETTPNIWDKLRSQISHSKSQAIQNIIFLLRSRPPDSHTEFSALTFPLFIAGCECEGKEEQLSLILSALKTLEVNFGIRNTIRAQEIIKLYWGSRSLMQKRHWLDLLKDMDWDLLLV